MVRGLPAKHPDQRETGHHSRTEHRRLRTGQDRERTPRRRTPANFGHREAAAGVVAARTRARTIATFRPTRQADGSARTPGRSRSSPGSSCESSPRRTEEQARLLRGNTLSVEVTVLRTAWVARMNALDDGPRRLRVWSWSCAGMPAVASASAKPSSSGTRSVPAQSDAVSSASPGHLVAPAGPDRGAERRGPFRPLDPPHLGDGGPAERRLARSVLNVPVRTTRSGRGPRGGLRPAPSRGNAPPGTEGEYAEERVEATRTGVTDGIAPAPADRSTTSRSGRRPARASAPGPRRSRPAREPSAMSNAGPTTSAIHDASQSGVDAEPSPRANAEAANRSIRTRPPLLSDRDLVADLLERGGDRSAHVHQVVDRCEWAVLLAVLHDGSREHLADAGQRLQFRRRCRVDVDQADGRPVVPAPARRRPAGASARIWFRPSAVPRG